MRTVEKQITIQAMELDDADRRLFKELLTIRNLYANDDSADDYEEFLKEKFHFSNEDANLIRDLMIFY